MLKWKKSKSLGFSHSHWKGFASSEKSYFRQLRSRQTMCVCICMLWQPTVGCLPRRKLLTDIWAHGEENTGDSAALEILAFVYRLLTHTHTHILRLLWNSNQYLLMQSGLHANKAAYPAPSLIQLHLLSKWFSWKKARHRKTGCFLVSLYMI